MIFYARAQVVLIGRLLPLGSWWLPHDRPKDLVYTDRDDDQSDPEMSGAGREERRAARGRIVRDGAGL